KRLVDNSIAAKPSRGEFLMVEAFNRKVGGYADLQDTLGRTATKLTAKGFTAVDDTTYFFPAPDEPLAGYCSWGSNDGHFDEKRYRHLTFKPGALAQTFVSTSGRTFNKGSKGQSLIGDLIEQ